MGVGEVLIVLVVVVEVEVVGLWIVGRLGRVQVWQDRTCVFSLESILQNLLLCFFFSFFFGCIHFIFCAWIAYFILLQKYLHCNMEMSSV